MRVRQVSQRRVEVRGEREELRGAREPERVRGAVVLWGQQYEAGAADARLLRGAMDCAQTGGIAEGHLGQVDQEGLVEALLDALTQRWGGPEVELTGDFEHFDSVVLVFGEPETLDYVVIGCCAHENGATRALRGGTGSRHAPMPRAQLG